MHLPEEYVVLKFFELGYYPKTNRYNGTYQCSCPICREGKSLGKKRRCYYIPKNNNIFCHNCGWSSTPINWIKQVSNKNDYEIIEELKNFTGDTAPKDEEIKKTYTASTLPVDSINLCDKDQINFYKNNDIIRVCLQFIKTRRLWSSINRPSTLYLSLTDKIHKNRLIIPFYNERGEIEFYQTRTILPSDISRKPKYLSKIGAEKTLFNINLVDSKHDYVYIFEGPLNAFFTKNSIAVAGITEGKNTFNDRQQQQINSVLKFYEKIWVLDSQWKDNASLKKTEILLKDGHKVFLWPEKIGKRFKDFNDIAIECKLNEIPSEFIQKNTFEGIEGILRLAQIKKLTRT